MNITAIFVCAVPAREERERRGNRYLDLEFTGVCIMVFYYTGQIVTFQLRRARPQRPSHPLCLSPLEWITILVDLILGFIDGLLLGSARLLLPECLTRD